MQTQEINWADFRRWRDSLTTAEFVAAQVAAMESGVTGCLAVRDGVVLVPSKPFYADGRDQ